MMIFQALGMSNNLRTVSDSPLSLPTVQSRPHWSGEETREEDTSVSHCLWYCPMELCPVFWPPQFVPS